MTNQDIISTNRSTSGTIRTVTPLLPEERRQQKITELTKYLDVLTETELDMLIDYMAAISNHPG